MGVRIVAGFLGCAVFLACGGGGGPGGTGAGEAETWTGTLTGIARGPFVCLSGTDGWYEESGTITLHVPAPGLAALLGSASTVDLTGSFAGTETAHEASGTGCAAPPSVVSTSLSTTAVAVRKVGAQLQLHSADTVLVPAYFKKTTGFERLDAKRLYLTSTSVGASQVTGTWLPESTAAVVVSPATFTLTRTSTGGGPPNAPGALVATAGDGQVTLTWSATAGATSYAAYRATSPGAGPSNGVRTGGIAASPYNITGLSNGTTYFFAVAAENAGGEGPTSAEVQATPAAGGGIGGGTGDVFVADLSPAVRVFARGATGDQAPLRVIAGASTQLSSPGGVSIDTVHDEVVVGDANGVVKVFARTASGNAAPLRTFNSSGSLVQVDPVNGEIAVCDGSVRSYARTTTGESPTALRTLSVLPSGFLPVAHDFVVDSFHDEILVVTAQGMEAAPVTVRVFPRTATGSPAPTRTLTVLPAQATQIAGLALDTVHDELWVTVSGSTSGTFVYARTASGSDAPLRQTTIVGDKISVDPAGDVGLSHTSGYTVLSRTGLNVLRSVGGAATGIQAARGITLLP